ncbi:MAG: hypothetical protein Q9162_007889 [Coniocarpon cinnabarinum]
MSYVNAILEGLTHHPPPTTGGAGAPVYEVQYETPKEERIEGGLPYHTLIYIDTNEDNSYLRHGHAYHVTYLKEVDKWRYDCEEKWHYPSTMRKRRPMFYKGRLADGKTWKDADEALKKRNVPGPVYKTDPQTGEKELVKPVYRCTGWIKDDALPHLWEEGIVDKDSKETTAEKVRREV